MSYPAGVSLAVLTTGSVTDFFGSDAAITATVTPVLKGTSHLVHEATGALMIPSPQVFTAAAGEGISFAVPHTDQDGWRDGAGNAFKGWYYKVALQVGANRSGGPAWTKTVQPIMGQALIDLDLVAGEQIGVPVQAPVASVSSIAGLTGAVSEEQLKALGLGGASDIDVAGLLQDDTTFTATAFDMRNAALLQDPETATGAAAVSTFALKSEVVGFTDTAASDFVNSWWCQPRSLYNGLRGAFYQGGVTREGTMQLAKFDLRRHAVERVDLGTFEKDDHNVPAFLVEEEKAPLVAIVRHSVESFVRVRVGKAPHDIASLATATERQVPFPAGCTYAHLIRRPGTNTVAVLTRNADGWYSSVSTDWGATWGAARKFHGMAYATFRQVGHVARYAATTHPITTPNNAIRYFQIDTSTGDVTSAHSGTVLGNLWSGSTVLAANDMTVVVQSYDPDTNRTFDVGRGGSIAAMKFSKTTPEAGGTYGVYRYKAGGTWDWEPIVASGVPVGYYQSSYVGGMGFGGNDDSVWLARESAGTWALERWAKNEGVWAKVDTIRTRTDGQLGRPQIPWGAEGTGLFTAVEYFRYPADTFMDYYGDQIARFTGITETVTPGPTLTATATAPTANDLQYTIPAKTGVVYSVNGVVTSAGTYTGTAGQTVNITAAPASGYTLTGTTSWSFTLSAPVVQNLVTTGSLMLVDAMQWSAGVPTATVPNLADGSTLTVANTLTATDGKAERTTKGGFHVAISQTAAALDKFFGLESEAVRAHLAANPTHAYYIGMLGTITRHATAAPPDAGAHKMVGVWGSNKNDTVSIRPVTNNKVSVVPSSSRTNVVETATPAPLGQPFVVAGSVSQVPAIGTSSNVVRFGTGVAAASQNTGTSWVLYAAYLEDLTVSGRSYAQAHAAFLDDYPTSVAAGDTWTAPGTLVA